MLFFKQLYCFFLALITLFIPSSYFYLLENVITPETDYVDYYVLKYRKILLNFILILIHMYPIITSLNIHLPQKTIFYQKIGKISDTYKLNIQGLGMMGNLPKIPQKPMMNF